LNGGKIVLPGNSQPGISAGILMGLFVRVKCKTIGRKRCGYAAKPGISAGILMGLFVRVKCKTIGRKRCGYAANVLYSG
jgi:hypothetical protein